MTAAYCPPSFPYPWCFLSLSLFPGMLFVVIFIVTEQYDTGFPELFHTKTYGSASARATHVLQCVSFRGPPKLLS